MIIVSFILKRDRTLQGKPRITHARLIGDADQERALGVATLSAITGRFSIATIDRLRGQADGRTTFGALADPAGPDRRRGEPSPPPRARLNRDRRIL